MAARLPRSIEELEAAIVRNSRVDGVGIENVKSVLACPFCGTPDFMEMRIAEMARQDGDYAIKGSCGRCGRSAETRITHEAGGTLGEFVQTGGDDPPEWFTPPMRRAEAR